MEGVYVGSHVELRFYVQNGFPIMDVHDDCHEFRFSLLRLCLEKHLSKDFCPVHDESFEWF